MNGAATQAQRAAVLDQLNASIDSFFGSGGSVQVLRGFEPVPRRAHHGPGESAGDQSVTERFRAELDLVQRVKEAAKTMTLAEAVRELGIGRTELHRMSKEHGFLFRSNNREHLQREAARQARAAEKARIIDLVRANSGKGLSRHFVAKRLGISDSYIRKIIEENGLDFPLYGDRP
jgi:AraC-like DNA-binding protein